MNKQSCFHLVQCTFFSLNTIFGPNPYKAAGYDIHNELEHALYDVWAVKNTLSAAIVRKDFFP